MACRAFSSSLSSGTSGGRLGLWSPSGPPGGGCPELAIILQVPGGLAGYVGVRPMEGQFFFFLDLQTGLISW